MTNRVRRLSPALIRPKGGFKLARWASIADNARRLQQHVRRLARAPQPQLIRTTLAKRRWRQRAQRSGRAGS